MAESSALIESLYALSDKSPKLVKHSVYDAPADKDVKVTSWKMNEFKYYDVPSPFPTLARGLFTTTAAKDSGQKYRVIARGYDKFFNIGEVPWTNWRAIERHTQAPYTLTLKSNGCIIFIAALSPSKLLITSKHSVGPVAGAEESHAQVGERWMKKHLEDAGKTEEQLAATLWDKNWTAVSELCDDSFEEHVLAIPENMTGLHLHGINRNVGEFNTEAQPVVDAFAEEWGFIKTASIVLDTEREVREFAQKTGETGMWNGEAVEGFVVRTTIGPRPVGELKDTPPYPPGSSFFFKIKFDEPYMMYRDWREITKSMLTAKSKGNIADAKISKARLKRKETAIYKQWVELEIIRNPKAFDQYQKNRGIIAVRDKFLKWTESPDGVAASKSVNPEVSEGAKTSHKNQKTVIIPIGVPGCGKTTISVALAHLFGFGHTQSDNIKGKNAANTFHGNIVELLKLRDVVIADRNNHLVQHRTGIRQAVSSFEPRPRLFALNWGVSKEAPATVHRIVTDRILSRGDNHQTLTPSNAADYEEVVWRFLREYDELTEDEVDDDLDMDIGEGLEEALERAVSGIAYLMELKKPTDEEMGEALRIAREYEPVSRAVAKQQLDKNVKKKRAGREPRYYGLMPEIELDEVMGGIINSNNPPPDSARVFWEHLKEKKRFAARPHVTIVHIKSKEQEHKAWSACEDQATGSPPPLFEITLGHLVWNERVMALVVDDVHVVAEKGGEEAGEKLLKALDDTVKNRLHITVGTKVASIPPVEAKDLVEKWRAGANVESLALNGLTAKGRIKGLMG